MSDFGVIPREGFRLARTARARTALVASTIFLATALAVLGTGLAPACWAVTLAVLSVARRSPRPERLASARAWARAGASRSAIWAAGGFEALLLGWIPTVVGVGVGAAVLHLLHPGRSLRPGIAFLAWELTTLGLAACLPTSREDGRRRSRARRAIAHLSVATRVVIVVVATSAMFSAARGVRTNNDLLFVGFVTIPLLVVVGVVATGPMSRWLARALGRVPGCQPLEALATRYRAPGTMRLVLVGSVTVASVATILGASVAARPETNRLVDARLARLPVLPRDVALVRIDGGEAAILNPSATRPFSADELRQLQAVTAQAVPHARLIALHDVGAVTMSFLCGQCNDGPVIVSDPRLRAIYGSDAIYPATGAVVTNALKLLPKPLEGAALASRVPTRADLTADVTDHLPLPPASFAGAVYYEASPRLVAAAHVNTSVHSVFIQAPAPLAHAQLSKIEQVVRGWSAGTNAEVTLIGPTGQLLPTETVAAPKLSASLRNAPWAATSAGSQWGLAAFAGGIALLTLLLTLTIDTMDRRRDVQRLERLGASPRQVRGGAAFSTAVLLIAVTWLSAALVIGLVKVGTTAFNHAEPTIPVPFTMPWAIVATLTLGLPALGAALAATVARPIWWGRDGR